MRRQYQIPEFEVKTWDCADIVTSSGEHYSSDEAKQDGAWQWDPWVKGGSV